MISRLTVMNSEVKSRLVALLTQRTHIIDCFVLPHSLCSRTLFIAFTFCLQAFGGNRAQAHCGKAIFHSLTAQWANSTLERNLNSKLQERRIEVALGTHWGCIGDVLGMYWDVYGTHWGRIRYVLGMYYERFSDVLGTYI